MKRAQILKPSMQKKINTLALPINLILLMLSTEPFRAYKSLQTATDKSSC